MATVATNASGHFEVTDAFFSTKSTRWNIETFWNPVETLWIGEKVSCKTLGSPVVEFGFPFWLKSTESHLSVSAVPSSDCYFANTDSEG